MTDFTINLLTPIRFILAISRGYFWLPCQLCGKYFGGFEVHEHYGNRAVCPRKECTAKAIERYKKEAEYWKIHPYIEMDNDRIIRYFPEPTDKDLGL